MNSIQKSMVYIKKEQIAIIIKEILHLKHILIFYKDNRVKSDMPSAFDNIRNVEESLIRLKGYLEILEDIDISSDFVKFIVLFDYIGKQINNSLHIIELVYNKVNQIFEEAHNQYIPRPTLGRRFSNSNLMTVLKENYQEIISQLSNKKDRDLVLSWSYKNYFQVEYSHDKFTKSNRDKYGNYINLPYWYYELPILLPSITHECGRIVLLQKDSKIEEFRKSCKREVKAFLAEKSSSTTLIKEERIFNKKHRLINKVLADIISYVIYGNAYIYSIFHDTIGLGTAELFNFEEKIKVKKDNEFENQSGNYRFHDSFEMKMSSWEFDPKRDITIIRLHILLSLVSKKSEKIKEVNELLNSIVSLDRKKRSSFEKMYRNHPHYIGTYQSYSEVYRRVIGFFTKWIKKEGIEKKIKRLIYPNTSFQKKPKIDFLAFWNSRFKKLEDNKILHKNEFRKLLHKKMIKDIAKYSKTPKESLGKPFVVTFTKLQKTFECKNLEKCMSNSNISKNLSCLDCYIVNDFDNKHFHSFGIYDLYKLKSTEDYENIDKHLNDIIKKLSKQNEYNKESNEEGRPTSRIRYYESKFSLMQIYPEIRGSIKELKRDTNLDTKINILYNIELNHRDEENFLYKAIIEIAEKLKDKRPYFETANIYKSLGPKDIMVIIDSISSKDLLFFNSEIASLRYIKRTFTTVLSCFKDKKKIKPNHDYNIVSYLRIKHDSEDTLRKKLKNTIDNFDEKESIKEVFMISGVLDIQIIWKEGTTTETIVNLYNIFMKDKLVTDFQTKFNKKLKF